MVYEDSPNKTLFRQLLRKMRRKLTNLYPMMKFWTRHVHSPPLRSEDEEMGKFLSHSHHLETKMIHYLVPVGMLTI